MRSSAILVAALVGVASAGMPGWPVMSSETASDVSGGGLGPTHRPHLGPGPVSERPRPDISFSKELSKDHHPKSEHHKSGGSFPTGGPKNHHPDKEHYPGRHHTSGGMFPSGGIIPSGGPKNHHPDKDHHPERHHPSGGIFPSGGPTVHRPERHHHHIPTGSGVGPTGTGHGGSPGPTLGPHTTTITTTSDVTSTCWINRILMTRTDIYNQAQ